MIAHVLSFALSLGLVSALAVCGAALTRTRDAAGFFVAMLLAASASLVLITEVLSLVHLWKPLPILILQVVALAAIYRPTKKHGDFTALRRARDFIAGISWRGIKSEPLAVVSLVFVGLVVSVEAVLAIGVAPNTFDSMTYHLTRVVYWMQESSVLQFPGAAERQAAFPAVAEILQGWTMLFANGDRFVQFIQWGAQLGVFAFAFALARDLGSSRRAAVLPIVAIAAMPVVMAQASSSQNDLVITFYLSAAMLFLLRGIKTQDRGAVVLAGVAGGLAFGTKSSGALLLIAVGVVGLIAAGREWRRLLAPAAALAISALLLGSIVYVQNVTDRGSLTGAPKADQVRIHSVSEIPGNISRLGWQSISSIPKARYAGPPKSEYGINRSTVEDVLAPGLPLLLLVLPALLLALIRPRTRIDVAVAVGAILSFLIVAVTLRYNLFLGRFSLISAVFAAPLVARFGARWPMQVIGIALLAFTFWTLGLHAHGKNVRGSSAGPSILRVDRITQMSTLNPYERGLILTFEATVPPDARVGFFGTEDAFEYPYAGPHYDRTLVKLNRSDLTPGVFEREDLDAILISVPKPPGESLGAAVYGDNSHLLILPK